MNYGEYAFDLSNSDRRPMKRPRQLKDGDDGHRPYVPISASPGVHADQEANGESSSKKSGRKRPLSCGECRRLKLKCDRVFPCQSCRKRGCAEICPDGALTGGKGSRFILANTEQLHDKIKTMSERIRDLEEGLHNTYAQVATGEHPLLRQDLLSIKKSPELFGVDSQPINHDSTPEAVQKQDDDRRASSTAGSSRDSEDALRPNSSGTGDSPVFSDDLTQLSRSFPSPWTLSYELDLCMRQRIRNLLPSRDEAEQLCEQARRNAFWQFRPDASDSFLPNLIHSAYTTPLSALMPHRLGLLLMILAIGSVVDQRGRGADKEQAEKYHHLARVALCEVPVMDDTSFDAVNALFFMVWYLLTFSDHKRSMEYAWGVIGLAVKLSHTISLHRDGVRSKVIPEEVENRRSLFWNLLRTDIRLSLMLRRPASINMKHVDVRQPTFNDDSPVSEYVAWQNGFLVECTIPVSEAVTAAQPMPYSDILGLDKRVRNFQIPLSLQMVDSDGTSPGYPLALQQALTACSRYITLLHLHRSYFTLALTGSEDFTVQHTYAPSVLAVYSGCCSLASIIQTIYLWEPEISVRYSIFWSNCFSAACALCFLVSRAPSLPIAPNALQELDRVSILFMKVRERCPKVASYFAVLHKLIARSREHYVNWRSGTQVFQDEMTDEICILVRKVVPATANTQQAPNIAPGDPFEHAHPFLRRCLEQATAQDPCLASGFHLTRIRGFSGTSIAHPQSDVRSYSGSAGESSRTIVPSSSSSVASPSSSVWTSNRSRAGSITTNTSFTPPLGALGAEIADSSWMSWL